MLHDDVWMVSGCDVLMLHGGVRLGCTSTT